GRCCDLRRREHDRDVARALLDLESATLCTGLETLERRALVHVRVLHVQVLLVEVLAVTIRLDLRVGHGRRDKLVDRLTGALLCELQDRESLLGLLALDERDDTTSLLRGHADVSHTCDGLHHFFSSMPSRQRRRPFLSSFSWPRKVRVGAN